MWRVFNIDKKLAFQMLKTGVMAAENSALISQE